jgi:hypothetical protein
MKYKDNTIVGIYKNFSGNFFSYIGGIFSSKDFFPKIFFMYIGGNKMNLLYLGDCPPFSP